MGRAGGEEGGEEEGNPSMAASAETQGDASACRSLVVRNGCDLNLLDAWEFIVERRIDEGTNFGQFVNE